MLEPRPEIKMPTRLRSAMMGGGPGSARAPAFGRPGDGAALLPGRNPADAEHGLARRFQFLHDPGSLGFAHYRNHADAAVEGAGHFLGLDIALPLKEGHQPRLGPAVGIDMGMKEIGRAHV